MKDIANEAGVSVATVSNYINSSKFVSEKQGAKIEQAIEKLGYVKNRSAGSLKSGKSNTIGVILPNLQDTYYVRILQGIEETCAEKGYCVMLGVSGDNELTERKYISEFSENRAAGIILATSQPNNEEFFKSVLPRVVFIDRRPAFEAPFIGFSNGKTVYNLTESLMADGAKRLTLIMGDRNFSSEREAKEGFLAAGARAETSVIETRLNKESAFRACLLHLQENVPDAIIATSRPVMSGVYECINFLGYENIRLAALGEDNWTKHDDARATLSARQAIHLGSSAVKMIFEEEKREPVFLEDKFSKNQPEQRSQAKSASEALRVLMLDNLQTDLFCGLRRNFENTYGAKVEIVKVRHEEMLSAIYASYRDFDNIMFDMPWLYALVEDGVLRKRSLPPDEEIFIGRSAREYGFLKGGYYGLPFTYAPQMLFYRKDFFEDRAIRRSFRERYDLSLKPPRTWKEFNRVAEFFTRSENEKSPTEYGTVIPAKYDECLMPEIYMRIGAYGGEIFDKENKVVFGSEKNLRAIKSFLLAAESYSPDCRKETDISAVDKLFSGEIAMLVTYPSFLSGINDERNLKLAGKIGFDHVPGRRPILGGWSLGISSESKRAELAEVFQDWACGEETANCMSILAGQSAIASSFDNNELCALYPWLPLYREIYDYAKPLIPPHSRKVIPHSEIDGIISKGIYRALSGDKNTEEIVNRIDKSLRELFEEYGY